MKKFYSLRTLASTDPAKSASFISAQTNSCDPNEQLSTNAEGKNLWSDKAHRS